MLAPTEDCSAHGGPLETTNEKPMSSLPLPEPRRSANPLPQALLDQAAAQQAVEARQQLIRRYARNADVIDWCWSPDDDELQFRVYFEFESPSHLTIHGAQLITINEAAPTIQQQAHQEAEFELDLEERGDAWEELTSHLWANLADR